MLRQTLLQMSKSDRVRSIVQKAPLTRSVVTRFIAGSTTDDGVRASSDIVHSGRLVTLDNLGEDTLDVHQADAVGLQPPEDQLRLLGGRRRQRPRPGKHRLGGGLQRALDARLRNLTHR